jgi:hypothetical protein
VRRADPIDLAVAQAFQRTAASEPAPLPPSRHQLARTLVSVMGVETMDPLTVEVAEVIFSFDQEAIEQPWHRLSEHRRQPYYDIAEAVIEKVRNA